MEKINASSMARIVSYLEKFDCGTISAYRGYEGTIIQQLGTDEFRRQLNADPHAFDQYKVKQAVNKKNNQLLKQKLLSLGYGVIAIYGVYKEIGSPTESKESSWFVFDYKQKGTLKKHLLFLGNQFQQDSITYADAGSDFNLYNTSPFSEEPNKALHKARGEVVQQFKGYGVGLNSEQQFFSRLGNKHFYWKDYSAIEIDSRAENNMLIGYTQPQAIVGFKSGVLQASIWTNDLYAERETELKELGITMSDSVIMAQDYYISPNESRKINDRTYQAGISS